MDFDKQVTTAHLLLETRVCRVCNEEKNLLDDFYFVRKNRALPSSYSYECKACTIERTTKYNKNNSTSVRSQYLKRNYGLTFEEFDTMLSKQDNCCAICKGKETYGRHKRFTVDHDHKTGKIRGLLCNHCNTTLGLVHDSIHTLQAMIQYLESHEQDRHSGDECSPLT